MHDSTVPRLVLVCLCCAGAAAEDADPIVVLHDGTRASPGANLTYLHDRLVWHPYAQLGGGWDGNPRQQPAGSATDGFADWALGTVADARPGVDSDLALCAALFQRRYRRTAGRDLSGGSLDARFTEEGPQSTLNARLLVDRRDDPLIETGRSVERDRIAGDLLLVRQGAANRLDGELRLDHVDFLEGGDTFGRNERDRLQGEARIGLVHLLSPTAEVGVRGSLLAQHYYNEGDFRDSTGARGELTGRMRPQPHLSVTSSAGFEVERFAGPFRHDPDYDDDLVAGPVAGALVRWDVSAGCWIGLSASSRWIESSTSNAARLTGVEGMWDQRLGQRANLHAYLGIAEREDASGGSDAAIHAQELSAGAAATLRVIPGLTTELRLRWRDYTPSDGPGYDELIASVLVAFVL
jgi:hypothetical protein